MVSKEERLRLLEGMPARVRAIARFLYASCCRVSEALMVLVDDCKKDGSVMVIRVHGKGAKERFVRIPVELYKEIARVFSSRWYRPGEKRRFLFESKNGGRYSRQYVYREVSRAARRVLGRRLGPHVLRTARGTDLLTKTRDLKGVADAMGHADVSTTARWYVRSRLSDDELFAGEDL